MPSLFTFSDPSSSSRYKHHEFPPIPLVLRIRRDKRRQGVVDSGGLGGYSLSSSTPITNYHEQSTRVSTTTSTSSSNAVDNVLMGGTSVPNISKHGVAAFHSSSSSNTATSISLHHIQDLLVGGPVEVLALAVRYDEVQGEHQLQVPLETGRLLSGDTYQFVRALEFLYEQTKPQTSTPSRNCTSLFVSTTVTPLPPPTKISSSSSPARSGGSMSSTKALNSNQSHNTRQQHPVAKTINWWASVCKDSLLYFKKLRTPSTPPLPSSGYALTPIILSGLISALQENQQTLDQSSSTAAARSNIAPANATDLNTNIDHSSELVSICQTMRQAALRRIRARKKQFQIQRIVIPITSLSILFVLYLRTMSDMRSILIQLGYVRSCDGMPAYAPACRLAEAALWYKYRDFLLHIRNTNNNCNRIVKQQKLDEQNPEYSANKLNDTQKKAIQSLHCNQDHAILNDRYREAPFALHTTLLRDPITFEELNSGIYRPSLTSFAHNNYRRRRGVTMGKNNSLRWLGETTLNRLVREAINKYLPTTMPRHIFDAGCGIGGTLYALLPEDEENEMSIHYNFTYHGVAASAAEIALARELVHFHDVHSRLDNGNSNNGNPMRIYFEQKSFEERLRPNSYTVIVAIESLSFSRNVDNTISNLVRSLQPGGILIMMDDIVYPTMKIVNDEYMIRPSLLSHDSWKHAFEHAGCKLKVARDLSLEYDILLESLQHTKSITSTNGGTVYKNYVIYEDRRGSDNSYDSDWRFNHLDFGGWLWDYIFGSNEDATSTRDPGSNTFWPFSYFLLDSAPFFERWLAHSGNHASQRLIELHDEKLLLDNLLRRRKDAYKQTILSYNFYVCSKE